MDDNIYSPPKSDLGPPVVGTSDLPTNLATNLATKWSRFWASLIDGLTIAPITFPLMYFTGGFDGITAGTQPSILYTLSIAFTGIVVFMLIHGYFLISNGQTLGKKALEIKIVTHDNQHAKILTLAKRYGFYWLIPQIPVVGVFLNLINVLFIFGKPTKCLHDYVGGTKVIKVSQPVGLNA